jgi:hypothetical protein
MERAKTISDIEAQFMRDRSGAWNHAFDGN